MDFLCTFTGVDQYTNFNRLQEISEKYRWVEFAILYSENRAGKGGRYQPLELIEKFSQLKIKNALHLCGNIVNYLFGDNSSIDPNYINSFRNALMPKFGRIQLNFNASNKKYDYDLWIDEIKLFNNTKMIPIILQYNKSNKEYIEKFYKKYPNANIDLLKDSSGGRGIEINDYSIPMRFNHNRIAFSGGIGPSNIDVVLENIYRSVSEYDKRLIFTEDEMKFGMDMETSLRINDKFNLDVIDNICQKIENFLNWKQKL